MVIVPLFPPFSFFAKQLSLPHTRTELSCCYLLTFPQVQQMLDQLSGEWVSFQQCLIDSDAMLKKSKEKFKTGLIHSSEDFKKTVSTLFDDFQNKGPFSSSTSVKEVRMCVAFVYL